jgi:DNA-binding MarR family transcriptional regulator
VAKKPARAPAGQGDTEGALAAYASRGPECVFANVRMLGRVVGQVYDEALRPAEISASQLALMWAILACEPVELSRLEHVTRTDQTTLSRTVERLRSLGWVAITVGGDRRTRIARLTAAGRRRFLRAMPYWEAAQREVSEWLSVDAMRKLGRSARRQSNGKTSEDVPSAT